MAKKMVFSRKVSISRPGSPSIRTTVPPEVAKMLGLENGDTLDWEVEPKGDSFAITIKRQTS